MSYTRIRHQVISPIDIDKTLIEELDTPVSGSISFPDPYEEKYAHVVPKLKNIEIVKEWHARGFYTMVWSARGEAWANAVVRALNLQDHVYSTSGKPLVYLDDLDSSEWMGQRIFLND